MVFVAIQANQNEAVALEEMCRYCKKEEEYSAFARALVRHFNLSVVW